MVTKKYVQTLSIVSAVALVFFGVLYISVRNETLSEVAALEASLNIETAHESRAEESAHTESPAVFGSDLASLDSTLISQKYSDTYEGIVQNTTVFYSLDTPENQYKSYQAAITQDGWVIINEHSSPNLYSLYAIKDGTSEINITIVPNPKMATGYQSQISVSESSKQ